MITPLTLFDVSRNFGILSQRWRGVTRQVMPLYWAAAASCYKR